MSAQEIAAIKAALPVRLQPYRRTLHPQFDAHLAAKAIFGKHRQQISPWGLAAAGNGIPPMVAAKLMGFFKRRRLQIAVFVQAVRKQHRIFGMNMPYPRSKLLDKTQRIAAHANKMRWIKINADI